MRVLGRAPRSPGTVAEVGFVAQDKPLYRDLTVAETLRMGAWLNPGWDAGAARDRIARVDIPMDQKVGRLSGGQRSQLALTVALSKRPKLLLLDEPVADLDPIARRDFLRTLMAEVAESGVTVVLSSHLLADVEKTCEYLVLLTTSHVQLADDTETLLSQHRMLIGPRAAATALTAAHTVVQADYTERQATLLVRTHGPIDDPMWTVRPVVAGGAGARLHVHARRGHAVTPGDRRMIRLTWRLARPNIVSSAVLLAAVVVYAVLTNRGHERLPADLRPGRLPRRRRRLRAAGGALHGQVRHADQLVRVAQPGADADRGLLGRAAHRPRARAGHPPAWSGPSRTAAGGGSPRASACSWPAPSPWRRSSPR